MVYIILGEGFEEIEVVSSADILRRGGVRVALAAVCGRVTSGAHGIKLTADCTVDEIDVDNAEMIVIPGGIGGVNSIENSYDTMSVIRRAYDKGVEIGAICAGPRVLAKLGILDGKDATCYPGMEDEMSGGKMTQKSDTVRCGKITTGKGPGAAIIFGLKLLEVLRGKGAADKVAGGMYYACC